MKKKCYLCRKLKRMLDKKELNISDLTTMGLPCVVKRYIEFESQEELIHLILNKTLLPNQYIVLGGGSNLIFPEKYQGIVLRSAIKECTLIKETAEDVFLKVGSAWVVDELCDYTVEKGWGGLENLSHIPGEIGAAAVQNVGAYGVEFKDVVVQVEAIDSISGALRVFDLKECEYGYRASVFKNQLKGKYIITAVTIHLKKNATLQLDYGHVKEALSSIEHPSIKDVRTVITSIRQTKLPEPTELGSVGSFFKNPVIPLVDYQLLLKQYPTMPHYIVDQESVKIPAAWLIDQRGWRGKSIGGAAVYEKQPLVLVNHDQASYSDFIKLKTAIQEDILKAYGIQLEPEAEFVINP